MLVEPVVLRNSVAAVKTGVGDVVEAVECQEEVILNHIVRRDAGGAERRLPILVGRRVGQPRQRAAAPGALARAFIKKRAAGLVGDLHAAIPLPQAGVNRDGGVRPDFKFRVPHVDARQILVVVGDMPDCGKAGLDVGF